MGVRGQFLKKRKLCLQNLTKEWKQPPVVILQQANFCNIFILCLQIRIIRRSDQGVQFMNFPSQIFFNDINHGYRAAILKKNSLWLLQFYMVWLLISIMKRCAERCALQLYQISLTNIKLVLLAKNIRSRLQPLDAGIIRNFKLKYRKLLLFVVFSRINNSQIASQIIEEVHILGATSQLHTAWKTVTLEIIKNCFQKCGFDVENN